MGQRERIQSTKTAFPGIVKNRQLSQTLIACAIITIALVVIPTFSWLYYRKSLETITRINRPNALVIGAGDGRPIAELELSDVDISGEKQYKDVVFCVYNNVRVSYNLQLAYTTNIGFTYNIFPATKGAGGGNAQVNYLGKDYTFDDSTALAGTFLNQNASTLLAERDGRYHEITYDRLDGTEGAYDNVQANAEPLYWKTSSSQMLPETKDDIGDYINYYVLRIQWGEEAWNNKETDMVYLMAESVN